MTNALLYFSTALIGACWICAQYLAARRELKDPRAWTIAATLLYLVIVSFTLAAGASGMLAKFDRFPPPMVGFFIFILTSSSYIAYSRFGTMLVKHTPLAALIAFQTFRLIAELIIWSGYNEGLAPRALSFHGYNFDIVTALTAPFVAWSGNRRLAWWWSMMGFAFLIVIAFIAFATAPAPFRIIMEEPSNVWVTGLPYTLLPGVLVTAAIGGQLLVLRKLKFLRV